MPSTSARRTYDHRLRDLVCASGDPGLFSDLGILRSTVRSWLRRGSRAVVSSPMLDDDQQQLQLEVLELRRRVGILTALVRLLMLVVRLSGFRLDGQRVPPGHEKSRVLEAIESSRKVLPLRIVLRVLGLSASRYHAWRGLEQTCLLDDRSSCPKT